MVLSCANGTVRWPPSGVAWATAGCPPVVGPVALSSGTGDMINSGFPLPIGSIVRAFNPEGVLAGEFIVKTEGVYGLMAVYMDDAATEVDERAVVGDALSFEIDGNAAEVIGPDEPVFTGDGGLLRLDLTISSQS